MRALLVSLTLLCAGLCAGCAANTGETAYDPSTHVDRVLEDVSAIIEGMASAHSQRRVVLRGPEYRSSAPNQAR